MSFALDQTVGARTLSRARAALRAGASTLDRSDPEGLRHVTAISVKARWLVALLCLVELVYRPHYGFATYGGYVLILLGLAGFNGYIHYRLRSERPVTWRWLLALNGMDVVLVSATLAISNGFSHPFIHLFYYLALAAFAVMFTSLRLTLAWVTLVSVVYVVISVTVGDGMDLEARDEKTMLARIGLMYAVVVTVNLASRFERMRWQRSAERERALERERVELSQAIHDTAAQSAFMVGLGIDAAVKLAGSGNPELTSRLEATSRLNRSLAWSLRHPINVGGIYEGRALSRVLRSHVASFVNVTGVPAELTVAGVEPALSTGARSQLFSIAHNALANSYRHAEAGRVLVELEYGPDGVRLSVSDDGVGLPDDYAERGQGFASMSRDTQRLGGTLLVERRGRLGGATVECLAPAAGPGLEDV